MKIVLNDIEIVLEHEPEDMPIRGNAMASGDDAADKWYEDRVIAALDRGNTWAWCYVRVRAIGYGLEGTDTLGGCSYASEKAFRRDAYYRDLVANAVAELTAKVKDRLRKAAAL